MRSIIMNVLYVRELLKRVQAAPGDRSRTEPPSTR